MASSSHHSSNKEKAVVATRGVDPSRWISDDETRERFLRWKRIKIVVPHMYLKLDLFEKEGFHFPEWIKTQGLSTLVQMKAKWYPNLVRVFYNNLKNINGDIQSRVKGVNIYINNDVWLQLIGLKAEGLFSHLRNSKTNMLLKKKDVYRNWLRFPGRYKIERLYVHEGLNREEKMITHFLAWVILPGRLLQDRMTTEDVFLLYAIKNDIPTNWVEVLKDHMIEVGLSQAHYLPYAVLIMKTEKGWRFKDEVNLVHSSRSTPAQNEERTNYFLETNFERFVAEQFKHLNERVTKIEGKIYNLHQQRVNNSSEGFEESSNEDSMDMSNSD
ncbi:hypothetical protein LR48_Vigan02g071500 [Vigna angularis]|uniref:Putative plant transposon protein domain-containing protein n=1 Tax=Phaseolus angularis TaxID=3914 RepID=A0A0L9TVI8_PHAAN|nr:hypothetical protein LR48_Vigan02g071500 [Vigna angularis]